MTLRNLHLLSDFPGVDDVLIYLENLIRSHEIVSVELAGSYARGEQLNSRNYVSDLEILIFYRGPEPPLCDVPGVDVDMINFDRRIKLDHTFFLYDFTKTSKLLYGKQSSVNQFGLSEIEAWSVDEIILWRVYAVAKAKMRGVEFERGALQRNFDYLVTFRLLKSGLYKTTMAERRRCFEKHFGHSAESMLLVNRAFRLNATVEELREVFLSNLPHVRNLFVERSMRDGLRNVLRTLRAMGSLELHTRRRLVLKLIRCISSDIPANEAITDVDAYYSDFGLRH